MALLMFTTAALILLDGVSDAAVDSHPECAVLSKSFQGEEIPGAGDGFDVTGNWINSERQDKGFDDCMKLCRTYSEAKGFSLRWFKDQKCSCFKTVTGFDLSAEHKSSKFCDCDLQYHTSILHSSSFALPAYCQLPGGDDVAPTSPLPHGATCNLTCAGSYVGTPGALECRARDWTTARERIVMAPEPRCHLNSTAVLYASIGGGIVAVLILFLLLVCCLRQKQRKEKQRAEKARKQVIMRNARGDGEEIVDGVDRRKSYKKATGHLSVDEESREVDLMINGRQDGIVYANVDLSDIHPQWQPRSTGAPTTTIGAPDVDPIYLEGTMLNENEGNQYVVVDSNRS